MSEQVCDEEVPAPAGAADAHRERPMRGVLGLPFRTPLSKQLMLVHHVGRKTGSSVTGSRSATCRWACAADPGGGRWKLEPARREAGATVRLLGRLVQLRPELRADRAGWRAYWRTCSPRAAAAAFVPFVGRTEHRPQGAENAVAYGSASSGGTRWRGRRARGGPGRGTAGRRAGGFGAGPHGQGRRRAFDAALAGAGGSLPVWLILLSVKVQRHGAQREIAEAVGIEGPTLTHHLNRMENAGLLTRTRDSAQPAGAPGGAHPGRRGAVRPAAGGRDRLRRQAPRRPQRGGHGRAQRAAGRLRNNVAAGAASRG